VYYGETTNPASLKEPLLVAVGYRDRSDGREIGGTTHSRRSAKARKNNKKKPQ